MISIKQINSECVKPVVAPPEQSGLKIKGAELFDNPYPNIFLCARKRSGKTSTIFKILKSCMLKDTNLIIFCSTVHKDPTYKIITKYFEDKGCNVLTYTSIMDDGVNQLELLLKHLEDEAKKEEEEEEEEKPPKPKKLIRCGDDEEECEKKRKKKQIYVPRDYIIVFDDLSTELRSKSVVSLLKKNRHYKMMCIMSSQYVHDIDPAGLRQIDYFLIFKGIKQEKLQHIHKLADLALDYNTFEKIYEKATEKLYSFLYIDTQRELYRRNFNCQFQIPNQ
jgi:hypothetical protein